MDFVSTKYDNQRRKCWMMSGCLMMTADGSVDPTSEQPTGNHTDVQPAELDPDAVDPEDEIRPNDPIFCTDEMKGKKYI